jgi:molecular chaperone HscA
MARIPINIATGSLQQNEAIVGIDLGTTNSLIAFIHPSTQNPICLKEVNANSIVPSVIYFDEYNKIIVGEEAVKKLETNPQRTIYSAKRLMGKSFNEINHQTSLGYTIIDEGSEHLVKVKVNDKFYNPIELSSFILKELKERAEHILKTPVNKAVITVPAYFNDTQRQATRDAGKMAGLDVLRIINEPTAASLAYGIGSSNQNKEEKTIAVYDLGGGTFDISILNIENGVFEVLSTNGDTYLGGDDFDKSIVDFWVNKNKINTHELYANKPLYQGLRLKAETAKKYLSENSFFTNVFEQFDLSISKDEFEEIIAHLVEKTITCCKKAVKDASIELSKIGTVILVGGSTRVPAVKKAVKDFFKTNVNDTINPDEVVALGAAIQADILAGNNKEFLLLDITPLSLGIETSGGLMDTLVPRNTKIPNKATRQYTTQKDGQSGIRVSVFQGERDLVKDNRKLAEFNLTGIPSMPAGLPKVEISFLTNADGILTVSAKELRSQVSQSIEVKPQFGISDIDVEKMLLDSIKNAQNDILTRALVEAKTEGEQILSITENFLQKNNELVSQDELLNTANAMQALQLAISMDNKDLIHKKVEELNEITRPFAERAMDNAVGKALSGKTIM